MAVRKRKFEFRGHQFREDEQRGSVEVFHPKHGIWCHTGAYSEKDLAEHFSRVPVMVIWVKRKKGTAHLEDLTF